MDPRLVGLLVCPRCRGELDPAPQAPGTGESELVCRSCRTRWPVVDGVPWLVEEHARQAPPEDATR